MGPPQESIAYPMKETLKKTGQNEPANRVKHPGSDEYPCGYAVDPECATDAAILFLRMRHISFIESHDIRCQCVPVCQAVVEQVSGDD